MRRNFRSILAAAFVTAAAFWTTTARAEMSVTFGTSWDGPSKSLQAIVDAQYGAGKINVAADYIGAHPGDIDPWFWVDDTFSAFLVREVAGNSNYNVLGWYEETGGPAPILDGLGDGVVFDGPAGAGATAVITFSHPMTRFGFYLDPGGPSGSVLYAAKPECFWTDRKFNDIGPSGGAAIHSPSDGDVQALVFDISKVVGSPNSWLVCFEDLDSGSNPAPCCTPTDNDYNDFIFEVHAFGATPVRHESIASIKNRYR